MPPGTLLSDVQIRLGYMGAGAEQPIIPGRTCGHIFVKGESCYRCKCVIICSVDRADADTFGRDCALDDSCVMCARCFHATNHDNHNVTFYIAQQSGGCCDCGDREAWRRHTGCPYHPPTENKNSISSLHSPPFPQRLIASSEKFPARRERSHIPQDLWDSMSRTVAYALDFILDTLDFSPDEAIAPQSEEILLSQATADPLVKDLFTVIVWNDEKHAFDEVSRHIQETCKCSLDEASTYTMRLDEYGRTIVHMASYSPRLLEMANGLSKIELGVTVRRVYDTFREQISSVLIDWLLDLTRCRLGEDTDVIREIIAAELLSPRRRDTSSIIANHASAKIIDDIKEPARLDWLFVYHTRLWKKPRLNLKEIYVSVLTLSPEHKVSVGEWIFQSKIRLLIIDTAVHYASVYHHIIDSYLLVDREAETSIKYFALQLFTVPSLAAHIVKEHNIIADLLAIITSFFTNQIQNKRVAFPPGPTTDIDVDSFPFKSKRFMPVFSDLRYICHNISVQKLIAHKPEFVQQFARTCRLFMCINSNKRAAANHVEYETDAWISVFNVTLSLSRVIKVYGEAFNHATLPELVSAIECVMTNISEVINDQLDATKFPRLEFHDVSISGKTCRVGYFDVLSGWVSFHHSLHWLLAELLKHTNLFDDENLKRSKFQSIRDAVKRSNDELLTIIDFPLRGRFILIIK